jgi:hypothetical protein
MTTLAPSYLYCSTTSAEVTTPSTLSVMGFAAGDVLVVTQFGVGSGASAPSAPTINGSSTGFTGGADTSGSDVYVSDGTSGHGRVQQFSKILSSGDLAFTVTVNRTAGFSGTTHRYAIGKLSHADGFDTSRVFQTIKNNDGSYQTRTVVSASWSSGTASITSTGALGPNIAVGDLVTISGIAPSGYNGTYVITAITGGSGEILQFALASNPGAYTSGGTIDKNFKLNDCSRPACVTFFYGGVSSSVALTSTIDGATTGGLYQRDPYFNPGSGSSQTDAVHGHHFNTGTVSSQGDFQEYDASDTIIGWLCNNNMGNSTHAIGLVTYQTAPAPSYLSAKVPSAVNLKANLKAGFTELTAKISNVVNTKADLQPTSGGLTSKISNVSSMGAPNSIDEVAGPGTDPITAKVNNAVNLKANLQTFSPSFLTGKISSALYVRAYLDFGTIIPITGSPFYIKWDNIGERFYESGLDRGVLYLQIGNPVAWNGLTEVIEKFGGETSPIYYDGRKIGEDLVLGDFSATLKAITYPDEFSLVDGSALIRHGILIGNQPPISFDLSWRTLIHNDLQEVLGYKIHILYNVIAFPSDKTDATLTNDSEATEFEWELSAIPQEIPGFAPSAHFVINSLDVDPWLLENIESLLYGNAGTPPNIPSLQDLVDFIINWLRIEVIDNGDGTWTATSSHDGVIVVNLDGTFSIFGINGVVVDADTYMISNT